MDLFITERALFVRERANGSYRPIAYFVSKIICDIIPLRLLPPLLFGSIVYPMIGLRPGAEHFVYFVLILVLNNIAGVGLCLGLSISSTSTGTANLFAVLIMLFYMLFSGMLVNKNNTPPFIGWMSYVGYSQFAYEALMVNELQDVYVNFNPTSQNTHITVNANVFLEQFGLHRSRFYSDLFILGGMAAGYLVIALFILLVFVHERR